MPRVKPSKSPAGGAREAASTPMMAQYRAMKARHPDALLFFRLGDFYELFEQDAKVAARELDLTLTSRDGTVPMCGVPYQAVDGYLARLVDRGYRVAICEQVEDPRTARGLVRREIVRVVSPGTLVDGSSVGSRESRYLAAVYASGREGAVAVADVASGHLEVRPFSGGDVLEAMVEELVRVEPAEVLLPESLAHLQERLSAMGMAVTLRPAADFGPDGSKSRLERRLGVRTLQAFGLEGRPVATGAAGGLMAYLEETQKEALSHFTGLKVAEGGDTMILDPATRRALELTRRGPQGARSGTLLAALDFTATAMGGRTLANWLESPLVSLEKILARQEAVAQLWQEDGLRDLLRRRLGEVHDLPRLLGRVAYGAAGGRELVALARSLRAVAHVREVLGQLDAPLLVELRDAMDPHASLAEEILRVLVDEPPLSVTEGGLVRPGVDPEIDRLRDIQHGGETFLTQLEERERQRTGIRSLKVGYNRVFGYYIEVGRAHHAAVPPDYQRRQTLAGAERYITPELKEWEEKILTAGEKLASLEYQHFVRLRDRVVAHMASLQATARAVADVDALSSLAEAARRYGYVRPRIQAEPGIAVREGRHPVLELSGGFVPNDVTLSPAEQIAVVTGPNMAGKSTYLRMTALLVLMAQVGSFVPAREATLGVVDRIFTRIGAADDLAAGKSTFMVEMAEVGYILRHATPRSLLVLDEIGRGTSTYDGLSIAWAVVEYVHDRLGSLCLVATHYHELVALADSLPRVRNLSVAVEEQGGEVVFLHRIVPGGADRSYGLHVARLAGLPSAVLSRAEEVLHTLENRAERRPRRARRALQPTLFSPALGEVDPVVAELLQVDVLRLTPVQALVVLERLQEMARRREGG